MLYFGRIGIDKLYRVRWRFDFRNERPTRYGIWDNSGGQQAEGFGSSAWCINKDGLCRAAIEAECQRTWTIKPVVECDGHDFVNFAWRAATPAPFLFDDKVKALSVAGQTIGLALESRETVTLFLINGTQRTTPRTAHDRAIHLAGFGR